MSTDRCLSIICPELDIDPLELFLNVSLNSVTQIFNIIIKWLQSATSCVRDLDATTVTARDSYVRDMILKLAIIHTSMIYHVNGSLALIRKNAIRFSERF